ncbi:hypothetical protein [Oryzobacter terrae]|uniref:hypothetical protein n=1 Tax=Oryzobacter terrae TaxID=1620385 RepID=UPI00366D2784
MPDTTDTTDTPTAGAPTSVRRRIADARATVVGTKGLRTRVAKHTDVLARLKSRLDAAERTAADQATRVKDLEARVKELDRAAVMEAAERERRDAQLGTLEVRLADLEECLSPTVRGGDVAPPDGEELAQARSLVEDVRTEHARVRARMQVVSAYEERLRRVEESVAELFEGDPRHLV